jgi:hypothetical protein
VPTSTPGVPMKSTPVALRTVVKAKVSEVVDSPVTIPLK